MYGHGERRDEEGSYNIGQQIHDAMEEDKPILDAAVVRREIMR